MGLYTKIKDVIIVICVIGAVFAFLKVKQDLQNANDALITYQQTISELTIELGKVRAETLIVKANSEKWRSEIDILKSENAAIYAYIKKADEKISAIGHIITTVPAEHYSDQSSTSVTTIDNVIKPTDSVPDAQVDSYNKEIIIKGKDKDDLTKDVDFSLALVKFHPTTKLWDVDTYGLNYSVDIIRAQNENGMTTSYVNAWMFNSKGDKIAVDVNANFTELKLTEKKFFWWTPNVNVTGDTHLGLGFSFSPMGYGATKKDLNWRFGQIGISHNGDGYSGKFIPFDWNIGQIAPFISNSYIGPSIDYNGKFRYGLTLSVSF